MQFAGRRIISTTLSDVPRALRAVPGCVAVSTAEQKALKNGCGETFKSLMAICHAEDRADAFRTFKFKPRKITAKMPKLAPNHRMAMLNAVYRKS